ncbi:hypothetical protein [Methanotorris formicicus]|uniref:Uncharacterized protein n=1 Tax=Methanotorris formicicus Mc-S-70 TaxID=647171 RepID=H1KZS4_9EURY|nr:hypothetical protein [Methanotorris formicicus]EHP85621.1 hypothetical protein MetfoDRAFT_1297 [Methanotorris formicicus Mc-S-70]
MAKITLGEALSTLKRKEMKFLRLLDDYVNEVSRNLSDYEDGLRAINLILSEKGDVEELINLSENLKEKAKNKKLEEVNKIKDKLDKLMLDMVKLKIIIQKTNKETGIDDYISELKYLKIGLSKINPNERFDLNYSDAKDFGLSDFLDKLEKRKYEFESKILNINHTTITEVDDEILGD